MADTKIASLTDGTSTSATDRIPVAISPYGSGNNAYITPAYLKTFMVTGGTVTTSSPVFDMTQTWNAGAQTFTGLKLNVTDTASASASLLLDLQVGGSSKGSLSKAGNAVLAGTIALGGSPTATLLKQAATDFIEAGTGFSMGAGSGNGVSMINGYFNVGPYAYYGFNGSNGIGTPDLRLWRDAANILALQNGTSAQTLNVYNTWSSAGANYERFTVKWSSNLCYIGTEAGGTGTLRTIVFGANPTASAGSAAVQIWGNSVLIGTGSSGANSWTFNSSGHVLASTDNAYDIGASGANRPRAIYCAGTIMSNNINTDILRITFINNSNGSNTILQFTNSSANAQFSPGATAPMFQFGGTTSSFPAIKRSTTSLQVRLADDSAFTAIQGKLTTDTAYTATPQTCSGYITIYDSTGTPYKVMVST